MYYVVEHQVAHCIDSVKYKVILIKSLVIAIVHSVIPIVTVSFIPAGT